MNKLDLYKIMQLHPNSDSDMIAHAYKKLCKKYHPDLNENTHDFMQKVNYAYEVLGNEKSRAKYDRTYNHYKSSSRFYEEEQIIKASENLNNYFKFLITDNYKKAYKLISKSDKDNISYENFKDWQKTVSKFYKIKDYNIIFLDNYYNKKIYNSKYSQVAEFKVNILEKDLASKEENNEQLNKFLVKEDNSWNIYLGYRKLKEYTEKLKVFNSLSTNRFNKVDSYKNDKFLKVLEKENYRKQRYGREYCLLVFEITNYDDLKLEINDNIHNYMEAVFDELQEIYRLLDEYARYEKDKFFLLLPETKEEEAEPVIDKTLSFFISQRPYKLKLDYVKINNLNFSASKIINLAITELLIKRRS